VFGFFVPRGLLGLAPRLAWLESPSTGIDHLRGTGVLESTVALTNVGGLFSGVIAEHVFAGILHFAKRLAHFEQLRRDCRWEMASLGAIEGKTLGLIGVGNIGRAVAIRARTFGMRVMGIGRRDPTGRSVPGIDRLLPRDALEDLLAAADYVVVAVTGSEETRRMIGRSAIAAMRPTAVLVNVARGSVIDEPALGEALAAGRIAGAALDVFAEEPLPKASPLWRLPNVLVTPHVAVSFPEYLPRAIGHFLANADRFLSGRPLVDRIDVQGIS
jgi:phosphoglycerate dehydrogenase-like enzyme